MTTLQTIIQSIDQWQTLPGAELHAAIVESDPQRRPEHEARHTAASLAQLFGALAVEGMVAALTTAGYPAMAQSLVARGLDFGDPQLQFTLGDLATDAPETFSADTIAALKALGIDSRSRWQRASGDPAPTEAETTAARQALLDAAARADRERIVRESIDSTFNAHVVPVLDSDDELTAEAYAVALEAQAAAIRGQ